DYYCATWHSSASYIF
nr:immunoglobulin light chain junction region [Macaca mulatta]MOV65777.1 immunoglobulin light chain junction region [Macaca mulatta]MOV65853.1 immunoglobulin light chain junction region [Macaca mulatta]MOV65856.1 immunoglobulin light chain junction region [Macaca mulatta]MOV65859.1 immunoglobulin light chain junction region [Macaca mulatta]